MMFLRTRARKPLAEGRAQLSYGMNAAVNDGKHGLTCRLFGDDDKSYSVCISNEELDRMVAFRDQSRPEFDAQDVRAAQRKCEHDFKPTSNWLIERCTKCGEERA